MKQANCNSKAAEKCPYHPESKSGRFFICRSLRNYITGKYYLDVTISGTPYHNRWSIWVYPPYNMPQTNIIIHDKFDSTVISALEQGKKVLLVADQLGKRITPPLFTSHLCSGLLLSFPVKATPP